MQWNGPKDHIIQAFLGGEEIAKKRDLVQTHKQKVYESNESFILRFRYVATDTYLGYEQNDDQQAILKEAFLKGLYSDELKKSQVSTMWKR